MAANSSYSAEFLKFIGTLSSATGDLSKMTAPAFLLSGYSLLEYSQHWGDHPELLYEICQKTNKEERMLAVTRWFVSTLYGSFRSRCETESEKKPFNPILGETFKCYWEDKSGQGWGKASCVVEQVSHHPPVSAFCVQLPATRVQGKPFVTVQGHCGQRTSMGGTGYLTVKQVGRVRLLVNDGREEYQYTVFPLPELSVSGLLSMSVFVELLGKTKITCDDGSHSEIEYVPVGIVNYNPGWFSGVYFTIKGWVKGSHDAKPYCTIAGLWTEKSTITKENGDIEVLFDAKANPPHDRKTEDLENQLPTESLKLWGPCASALRAQDFSLASSYKSKIEEEQRSIRKARIANKEIFVPKYFDFVLVSDSDKNGATQLDPQQRSAENEHGNKLGHWVFKN